MSPGNSAGSVLLRGSAKYSGAYSIPHMPNVSYSVVVKSASNHGTGMPSPKSRFCWNLNGSTIPCFRSRSTTVAS
jgi:hypothetical protein